MMGGVSTLSSRHPPFGAASRSLWRIVDLTYLQKRQAELDGERAALEALMDAPGTIDLEAEIVDDLVEVFSSWSDLALQAKRALLSGYGMQIVATVDGQRKRKTLKIERFRFSGLPVGVWLYN